MDHAAGVVMDDNSHTEENFRAAVLQIVCEYIHLGSAAIAKSDFFDVAAAPLAEKAASSNDDGETDQPSGAKAAGIPSCS